MTSKSNNLFQFVINKPNHSKKNMPFVINNEGQPIAPPGAEAASHSNHYSGVKSYSDDDDNLLDPTAGACNFAEEADFEENYNDDFITCPEINSGPPHAYLHSFITDTADPPPLPFKMINQKKRNETKNKLGATKDEIMVTFYNSCYYLGKRGCCKNHLRSKALKCNCLSILADDLDVCEAVAEYVYSWC